MSEIETKLYQSKTTGEVACKHCVPTSKSAKRKKEKWARMTPESIRSWKAKIGGPVSCDTCQSTGVQTVGKRALRHMRD